MTQIHPLTRQKSVNESSIDATVEESETSKFSIIWDNLKYDVIKSNTELFIEKRILQKKNVQKTKTIFNGLCGEFKCGELSALMGPSGAGKSTLLECICVKREKGKSGFVGLTGNQKVNIAFIPQHDHFFYLLTVREALMFASKLQNSVGMQHEIEQKIVVKSEQPIHETKQRSKNFHENIVNVILKQLSLEICAEVRISNLSGGQMKRLSIAQELVAKPDVLILDEPTSGLDSSTCFQTVELLRTLAEQTPPIAIIATIHQPSAKVFNLFHRVYVLSVLGKCIFNGAPTKLLPWLNSFGLTSPEYYNPADFIIEISYGEYGQETLLEMANAVDTQNKVVKTTNLLDAKPLEEELYISQCKYSLEHIRVLFHRSLIFLLRDPLSFVFRLAVHLIVGLFMALLFSGSGIEGGCPPDLTQGIKFEQIETLKQDIKDAGDVIYNNLGNLFFTMIFAQFQGVVLNVITFPLTLRAIKKETSNGWYSAFTYYFGYMSAEMPMQVFNSWLFATIVYFLTSQPYEIERYSQFSLLLILISLVAQAHGVIFGLLFEANLTAAVFIAPATAVPYLLFSGFLLKTDTIPLYLTPFSILSYMRYALEGTFIAVYGNLRCGEGTGKYVEMAKTQMTLFMHSVFRIAKNALVEEYEDEDGSEQSGFSMNITDSVVKGIMPSYLDDAEIDENGNVLSFVIHSYKLSNKSYWDCVFILLIFGTTFRLIGYYIFNKKVNTK
ncbi:ATP-binding cassette sub-family G member 1-like isoform X2 [Leptotrombidium deliense]|uniref:ATP-binding cassette sub-family G member 1-like isoform X2 n=1 Tax=Leptotrombidium deliense TaxID=299467 RepID=A0A443SN58_9ACAR|nr:ATP-binding cassette sub-family G member 1-like isoform X2 [Leptotrombidium deliense]